MFGEIVTYEDLISKLTKVCTDNELDFIVRKESYPFSVEFTAGAAYGGQMSLLDDPDQEDKSLEFIFYDGKVIQKAENLNIDDSLANKLKLLVKKIYAAYMAQFFREHMYAAKYGAIKMEDDSED